MDIFRWLTSRYTNRGKALIEVRKGMGCAKKNDPENAVNHYTLAIDSLDTPPDVKAMALFNRALVYAATGKEPAAKKDLNMLLDMPETLSDIKTAARQKIVRMQRKVDNVNIGGDA